MTPGATLTFSQANHNAITVSDPGANGQIETVNIEEFDATLNAGSDTTGLTSIVGNGTEWLSMSSTISALNSALDGLQLTPVAPYTPDYLDITIANVANTGGTIPGEKTAFLGTQIIIAPPPDAPTLDLSAAGTLPALNVADTEPGGVPGSFMFSGCQRQRPHCPRSKQHGRTTHSLIAGTQRNFDRHGYLTGGFNRRERHLAGERDRHSGSNRRRARRSEVPAAQQPRHRLSQRNSHNVRKHDCSND